MNSREEKIPYWILRCPNKYFIIPIMFIFTPLNQHNISFALTPSSLHPIYFISSHDHRRQWSMKRLSKSNFKKSSFAPNLNRIITQLILSV